MLWAGILFLVFLVFDILYHPKTKHKTRSTICMIAEGMVAIGFILAWIILQ